MTLKTIKQSIRNVLLYLSNNEDVSKKEWETDEVAFDIGFLIALFTSMFLALVCWVTSIVFKIVSVYNGDHKLEAVGSILSDGGWIFIAVIFFIEAYDSLRHNRTWSE